MLQRVSFLKKQWKSVARFTGSELINVLLTAVSGFLMIHHLPKETYGVYGFLFVAVNLAINLSEIGINHCFLPLVGYTNVTTGKVNAITQLFRKRRIRLLLISGALVIFPTLLLMNKNGWLSVTFIISFLCMLIGGFFAVNEQLFRQKFTALRETKVVARSTSVSSIVRTLWILLVLFIIPESLIVIFLALGGVVGSLAGIYIYKKAQTGQVLTVENINEKQLNEELNRIYKPLRLSAFLYVLYANFGGLAIGWFGNVVTVANVNASGRMAMCLLIVDRLAGVFIIPRLAQAPTTEKYIKLLISSLGVYTVFVTAIVLSAWIFPDAWLVLIGKKYSDLRDILWMSFLGSILTNMSGFVFTCMTARGYTSKQLPIFIAGISLQALAICFLGMYDAKSVFIINIIVAGVFTLGNVILLFVRIKRMQRNNVLQIATN